MFNSQDRASNGLAFRDDRDDADVVDQMYDTADQMGEDMPIGLGKNFEYRGIRVELEQADLSTVEQEQVDQVLALPSNERAADILLASEGLIWSAAMRPNRNDTSMQAKLMKLAKKGSSSGSAGGSQ
ncbi:hypothetical protein L3X38_042662 [Prunus dulcis]|uniref:Uncharacterized protein n=1 Tax=Prunus dulcis TaxID=3755 RepID=A0AAD4UX16_PRUDU|nr:hypothetical protein L3X38_042662 [Prunus dulcis]